jgi:hypothetical protein
MSMIAIELLANPALPRAVVVGVFGGVGLALTTIYSRRGPLIYPAYAALLAALALLLARYDTLALSERFAAALAGFLVASSALYATVTVLSDRQRRQLVADGRLPASSARLPLSGHAWRLGSLLAIGVIISAGIAYITS